MPSHDLKLGANLRPQRCRPAQEKHTTEPRCFTEATSFRYFCRNVLCNSMIWVEINSFYIYWAEGGPSTSALPVETFFLDGRFKKLKPV